MWRAVSLAALVVFSIVSPVWADQCNDIVVDNARIISDVSAVTQAAQSLASRGLTVRVRTYETGGVLNLDQMVISMRDKCPSWQSDPNNWKSTMFVLAYAPYEGQIGAYYGVANQSRFGAGKWQDVLRDKFLPHSKAYTQGDHAAMTAAFVASLMEFEAVYAKPSTGGNVTVVNQGSSHNWIIAAMIILLMFVTLFGGLAYILSVRRRRAEVELRLAEERRHAQEEEQLRLSQERLREAAERETVHAQPPAQPVPSAPPPAPVPTATTTIVHDYSRDDGFLTGILLGEALSRPTEVIHDREVVIRDTGDSGYHHHDTDSDSGGSFSNPRSDSDSGGSFSSSDSGSSSDGGGSFSSSC